MAFDLKVKCLSLKWEEIVIQFVSLMRHGGGVLFLVVKDVKDGEELQPSLKKLGKHSQLPIA